MFLAALMAAMSATMMADTYEYLTASYNEVEQSFSLASIKKITFEGDQIVVYTTEGEVRLPQEEISKMYFTSTPTAIESMAEQSKGLQMQDGKLTATGKGMLHIYNSNGTLLQMAQVNGTMNISLSELPKGVYIVNLGKETIKVAK